MNYLFWNTGKNKINNLIASLINEYACDIVALAEYEDDISQLISILNNNENTFFYVPKIACKRIDILTKYTPSKIKHLIESGYYTIKKIPHQTLGNHIIAFVHLPSKLHMTDDDYLEESRQLKIDIEQIERKLSNNRTVIVGDFNMNPFEKGMVSASSIHSVPSRIIASRNSRIIKGREYSMFYNPMWNLFGDNDEPFGTYFYSSSEHVCYYWNIFDQVIVRPILINNLDLRSVKIIKKINNTDLTNNNSYPVNAISDHLPIYFSIV